jgi:hypothetical protein
MSVSTASSGLAPTGLAEDQLQHFSEHGWVLLEGVVDRDLCRACIDAIDGLGSRLRGFEPDRFGATGYGEPHMFHPVFLEPYTVPGLVEAIGQLVGHPEPRYMNALATIADPLPPADREGLLDPSVWAWHRDIPRVTARPGAGPVDHPVVNAAMYFVPVAPEHGVTAFLDGSHRLDAEWEEEEDIYAAVGDRFSVVQPTAEAGSVVLFAATLLHAARPVLSEQRRYATFNWLGAPWMTNNRAVAPHLLERLADERLRSLFRPAEELEWAAVFE